MWTPGEANQLECTRRAINLSLGRPQRSLGDSIETPRGAPEAAPRHPREVLKAARRHPREALDEEIEDPRMAELEVGMLHQVSNQSAPAGNTPERPQRQPPGTP